MLTGWGAHCGGVLTGHSAHGSGELSAEGRSRRGRSRGGALAAAGAGAPLRVCAPAPGEGGGGGAALTSPVVPRVELLDAQLVQGPGQLQLLPGHVVPQQHHVLGADAALGADDRQDGPQRRVGAHAHHGLLRPQVVHHQAHGLLRETRARAA